MRRFVERFENFTYIMLIIFLVVLLFFALLELGWLVVAGLFEDTAYRLDSDEFFSLPGYFLLVLIGLELLERIKAYLRESSMSRSSPSRERLSSSTRQLQASSSASR
jgi:uncharacterized membrane protein (DUF373 family)